MMVQEEDRLRLEEPSPEEDVTPNTAEYVTHVITYSKYFALKMLCFQLKTENYMKYDDYKQCKYLSVE